MRVSRVSAHTCLSRLSLRSHTYVSATTLGRLRTTVRLDEGLLREAKAEAARQGKTVTALIERGLRLVLAGTRARTRRARVTLPVSKATGGTRRGIDLDNSSAVLDRLDHLE